jgi:hypothetical protein
MMMLSSIARRHLASNRATLSSRNLSRLSSSAAFVEDPVVAPEKSTTPTRPTATTTNDDLDAEAHTDVATEGEWAGCSRRFMAPITTSVRGSDILK